MDANPLGCCDEDVRGSSCHVELYIIMLGDIAAKQILSAIAKDYSDIKLKNGIQQCLDGRDTLSSNNPTFPAVSGLGILAFITLPFWVHPPETTSRRSTLIYRAWNGHDIIASSVEAQELDIGGSRIPACLLPPAWLGDSIGTTPPPTPTNHPLTHSRLRQQIRMTIPASHQTSPTPKTRLNQNDITRIEYPALLNIIFHFNTSPPTEATETEQFGNHSKVRPVEYSSPGIKGSFVERTNELCSRVSHDHYVLTNNSEHDRKTLRMTTAVIPKHILDQLKHYIPATSMSLELGFLFGPKHHHQPAAPDK
ncbi:hypothetical protein CBL_13055 [Carabus blaptoides fortunei]